MGKVRAIPEGLPRAHAVSHRGRRGRGDRGSTRRLSAPPSVMRMPGANGRIGHAEGQDRRLAPDARRRGSRDGATAGRRPAENSISLLLYVENCDAVVDRAVKAGAEDHPRRSPTSSTRTGRGGSRIPSDTPGMSRHTSGTFPRKNAARHGGEVSAEAEAAARAQVARASSGAVVATALSSTGSLSGSSARASGSSTAPRARRCRAVRRRQRRPRRRVDRCSHGRSRFRAPTCLPSGCHAPPPMKPMPVIRPCRARRCVSPLEPCTRCEASACRRSSRAATIGKVRMPRLCPSRSPLPAAGKSEEVRQPILAEVSMKFEVPRSISAIANLRRSTPMIRGGPFPCSIGSRFRAQSPGEMRVERLPSGIRRR